MTDVNSRIPTSIVGAAGEHFVLYKLFRQGLRAGRPPEGTPEVDLLILDEKQDVVISLQVKTRARGSDGGWHMSAKHESLVSDRLLYVFVDLEEQNPTCYIVPSKVVARYLWLDHSTWLATPGAKGQKHNDTKMRRVRPFSKFASSEFPDGWLNEYQERWELLRNQ